MKTPTKQRKAILVPPPVSKKLTKSRTKKTVECKVNNDCPKKYRRKDLVTIAESCGITIKRDPPKKGLKSMDELCIEILQKMAKSGESGKQSVSNINDLTERAVKLRKSIVTAKKEENKQYGMSNIWKDLRNIEKEVNDFQEMILTIEAEVSQDFVESLVAVLNEFVDKFNKIKEKIKKIKEIYNKIPELYEEIAKLYEKEHSLTTSVGVNTKIVVELRDLKHKIGRYFGNRSRIEPMSPSRFAKLESRTKELAEIVNSPDRKDIIKELKIFVDKKNAVVNEIIGLIREEDNKFGGEGPIYDELRRTEVLLRTLENKADQNYIRESTRILDNVKDNIEEIKRKIETMGRRCINKLTPISMEEVDEVPEEDWIRFKNGACWDILTLIEYIKQTTKGQNISEMIKRWMPEYPSDKIWDTNDDYRRMVNHPRAKDAHLHGFIESQKYSNFVKDISDETTKLIYESGSKLWSRGPPFETALKKELNKEQLKEWNKAKRGMSVWELPNEIAFAPENTVKGEIKNIINGVIKTEAISKIWNHYKSLSKKEKDALKGIHESLGKRLRQCHGGELLPGEEQFCVMQMGDLLIRVYNRIANNKENFEILVVPGLIE